MGTVCFYKTVSHYKGSCYFFVNHFCYISHKYNSSYRNSYICRLGSRSCSHSYWWQWQGECQCWNISYPEIRHGKITVEGSQQCYSRKGYSCCIWFGFHITFLFVSLGCLMMVKDELKVHIFLTLLICNPDDLIHYLSPTLIQGIFFQMDFPFDHISIPMFLLLHLLIAVFF